METKNTITINKNLLVLVIIFIIAIIISCVLFLRNDVNNKELFELKQKCAEMAQEFAKKHTGPGIQGVNELTWEVLHSDYNISKVSCFGEFDVFSYFLINTNESFYEYRIYDLINETNISTLTYIDRNPGNEEWSKYFFEKSPEYYKIRKEIFGLDKDQY